MTRDTDERGDLANELSIAGYLRIENGRLLSPSEKQSIVAALAGWARNWHWKDCADDKHVDPSIYFRDRRLLKAFIAEFVAPVRPAPADKEDQGPDTLGERP